ncbi:MAG: DUF1905 domain-containing protein [Alphaproteobacteria bacterium]
MMDSLSIEFTAPLLLYKTAKTAWHYISIPPNEADLIRFWAQSIAAERKKRGFGALKIEAYLKEQQWKTSLFPDKENNSYILPIRADIRKAAKLNLGDDLTLRVDLI